MLAKHFIRNACSFGLFLLSCCFVFLLRSLPSLFFFKKKKETCILTLIKEKRGRKHQETEARQPHARSPLSNLRSRTAVTALGRGCACYRDQTPSVFHSPAIAYKDDQLWIKWGFCFYSMQISLYAAWPPPPLLPTVGGLSPGHSMCLHTEILDQPSLVRHIKSLVTITWHRYFSISSVSSHFLYCYLFFQKPVHIILICIP